ncbi:MAG: zf-HC2 domain-containing protein [Thermoleophilaceae bacterium]
MNRCLSEGRASFVDRVAGIERGAECERLAPLVSLAADGEASPDQVAALRPHLSGCLACRARLREYRRAPARAAAAVAPVGVVGFARWLVHGAAGHVQAAASLVPTAAAQKAAVVAAAVAVAGGGGLAVVHRSLGADPPRPRAAGRRFPSPQRAASPAVPRPAPAGAVARRRSGGQVRVGSRPRVVRERSPSRGSADHHVPSHRSAPPTTGEFTPTPAPSPQPRVTPPGPAHSPRPTPGPTGGEFAP